MSGPSDRPLAIYMKILHYCKHVVFFVPCTYDMLCGQLAVSCHAKTLTSSLRTQIAEVGNLYDRTNGGCIVDNCYRQVVRIPYTMLPEGSPILTFFSTCSFS
jgi:hypothetical protein